MRIKTSKLSFTVWLGATSRETIRNVLANNADCSDSLDANNDSFVLLTLVDKTFLLQACKDEANILYVLSECSMSCKGFIKIVDSCSPKSTIASLLLQVWCVQLKFSLTVAVITAQDYFLSSQESHELARGFTSVSHFTSVLF